MSIDLNWETLTGGPDGEALAERIRVFIHTKFQMVPLPRFIRSVNVHGFDFGTVAPELALKDITDPLPDFYEQEDDDDEDDGMERGDDDEDEEETPTLSRSSTSEAGNHGRRSKNGGDDLRELRGIGNGSGSGNGNGNGSGGRSGEPGAHDFGRAFLTHTPGILGGPGRSYFQHQFATGTQTPLAAVVAGAHMGTSWMGSAPGSAMHTPSHSRRASTTSLSLDNLATTLDPERGLPTLSEKSDVSTMGPPSRPSTRDAHLAHLTGTVGAAAAAEEGEEKRREDPIPSRPLHQDQYQDTGGSPRREPRVEDVQAVFRIRYSGDVRLNLTAEILLDYPMPSFVGIPLKLSITGLSFDGVGVLAYIRKKVHFCFLSPEDALAAVGDDGSGKEEEDDNTEQNPYDSGSSKKRAPATARFAGLLQEIKVESEIGERDGGKQSLKNVGKVERFVLEQVRRIFEEEFVYPSFWTFLV